MAIFNNLSEYIVIASENEKRYEWNARQYNIEEKATMRYIAKDHGKLPVHLKHTLYCRGKIGSSKITTANTIF